MKKIIISCICLAGLVLSVQAGVLGIEKELLAGTQVPTTEQTVTLSTIKIADFESYLSDKPASVRLEINSQRLLLLQPDVQQYVRENTSRFFISE